MLIEHDSVRAAAVTVHLRAEEKELAAFVVPRDPGKGVNRQAIADLLRSRLPAYMLPKYLEVIEALPTLQSGKIDREALPPPKTPLKGSDGKVIAPRNKLEQQLTQIWCELFAIQRVSIDDDFFLDLGGHSLLAAQAVSALRRDLGIGRVSVQRPLPVSHGAPAGRASGAPRGRAPRFHSSRLNPAVRRAGPCSTACRPGSAGPA